MAAEKKTDSARFRGRPAWVLYHAKRYDEAVKAYRELIDEFDADHASAETRDALREARLSLSNLCVIKGDLPQAEEWLEQVLDEFPDDAGAMNDLGYLWADRTSTSAGRADDPPGRRRRARQHGLPRQPRLGAVPPGKVPAGRGRIGEGRRRQEARRHGPRSPRRRLSKANQPRQGRRGLAQGGGGLSAGKGNRQRQRRWRRNTAN